MNKLKASKPLRILFVGETWQGSSARSMREALAALPSVSMDEIGEDHYLPRHRMKKLRAIHRLLAPVYRADLRREIELKCISFKPDVLMIYKGNGVDKDLVNWAQARGIYTVNVFPDYSPHAYGSRLKLAMGAYDLVISTKPFHPGGWREIYSYQNECVCVPHGYDPTVHYWADQSTQQDIDVVLAASWRPQYEGLMVALAAELEGTKISVSLAGPGWVERSSLFPDHWQFPGSLFGRAYGEMVRRGKIVIAPVHRDVIIDGIRQPGDEDTTRTYELAAASCFFLHQRTPFAQEVYDEKSEVPMWDDAAEMARLIKRFLPDEIGRRAMAARAHARAAPNYSIPARAVEVLEYVRGEVVKQKGMRQ